MRASLILFSLLLILSLTTSTVFASGFQLKAIGALDVDGATYKHLWYTNGNNLRFRGIALQNTQVTITINGASETVNSDSEGNWSYTTTLAQGDHLVTFTSNESTLSFTLTIGEVPENIGPIPKTETPTVGTVGPTIIILSLGIFFTFSTLILKKFSLI